ncbi:hypothetical protein C1645_486049 [Glomus cerebriforme]|uniref:Uncharacterized protein n=1 Tax=Glomus cerebriforme TaxID=658196 RepID=A0A397TGE3_9GLOM|nr:hypothetical protein C1645_486049 [Glomus cerebriforme]
MTTTLATTDIKALNIITSNFGGFNLFSARFSEEAEKRILYGSLINFIIEDLTQLIIQILYFKRTIAWNIIPLLSLISNGFIIIMDIYEYWFEIYHHIQGKYMNETNSNDSTKLDENSLETSFEITPVNSISVNKEIAENDDVKKNNPAEEITMKNDEIVSEKIDSKNNECHDHDSYHNHDEVLSARKERKLGQHEPSTEAVTRECLLMTRKTENIKGLP